VDGTEAEAVANHLRERSGADLHDVTVWASAGDFDVDRAAGLVVSDPLLACRPAGPVLERLAQLHPDAWRLLVGPDAARSAPGAAASTKDAPAEALAR
jgi:hypothetical protein